MSNAHEEGADAKPTWAAFKAKVSKPGTAKLPGMDAESRDRFEKHGQRRVDGRSKRRTGRDVKMTTKVRPEFKAKLAAKAARHGVGAAEVLERALEALGDKW